MKVGIVGGSGYTGGELLRLLLRHPKVDVAQVTSDSMAGKPVSRAHPNLRKVTDLTFTPHDALDPCDLLFLAMPHGRSMARMPDFLVRAGKVIDLSADFRLKDPALYRAYYGVDHPHPELLKASVYGLPELHRDAIREATLVAGLAASRRRPSSRFAPLYRQTSSLPTVSSWTRRRDRPREVSMAVPRRITRSALASCASTRPPGIDTPRRLSRRWA